MTFSWPLGAVIPLLMVTGCPAVVVTPIELVARDTALVKSRLKSSKDDVRRRDELRLSAVPPPRKS